LALTFVAAMDEFGHLGMSQVDGRHKGNVDRWEEATIYNYANNLEKFKIALFHVSPMIMIGSMLKCEQFQRACSISVYPTLPSLDPLALLVEAEGIVTLSFAYLFRRFG
jgi:hypothetical protein